MVDDDKLLSKFSEMQRDLMATLRLKDVLDTAVLRVSHLSEKAKVALFLSDNQSMAFKLMAAKGYAHASLNDMRLIPFSAESVLKFVVQRRCSVSFDEVSAAPRLSAQIMQREGSAAQIALPLISSNLLVGAMVLDLNSNHLIEQMNFLEHVADAVAMSIANAILFGRSEYERERLRTLYKSLCALSSNALRTSDVLRIATDTALVLGNTPNCALLLYDAEKESFNLAAFKGLDGSSLNEFNLAGKNTIAGITLKTGRSEYIGEGSSREPYGLPRATGGSIFSSVLALPLIYEQQPLGVLEVFSVEGNGFQPEQIELLESFTRQISTALHVAFTHESSVLQSIQDAHTGLFNRTHFEEALIKEVDRSDRHRHQIGLLLIDLDHLGQVNEHLGEQKGDEAIKHVAKTIKDSLRDIDVVCRWGGEEFAVMLPETGVAAVLEVAERLRMRIRGNVVPGVGLITASIGVSTYPDNSEEPVGLVQAAEQALAVAKYQGRDRVVVSPTAQSSSNDPAIWADLVKEAKLTVISERQSQLKSRLNVDPEYASWLSRGSGFVKKQSGD
jgi:diguanylate cyclase (GGDEF)-like protein